MPMPWFKIRSSTVPVQENFHFANVPPFSSFTVDTDTEMKIRYEFPLKKFTQLSELYRDVYEGPANVDVGCLFIRLS